MLILDLEKIFLLFLEPMAVLWSSNENARVNETFKFVTAAFKICFSRFVLYMCYWTIIWNKFSSFTFSTGASDRSFYPIFNKRFDHLEKLITICRPKKVLSTGSVCRSLVPSPQSKCPKRTFMLSQKYHASVSNMLLKPLKCFMENEN